MQSALSFKSLKAHTVQNRFTIIIALIFLILVFVLVNFWFSVRIMSGIRAYVGGEGLWSKSQKEAVSSLVRYASSRQESDYLQYEKFLQVPLGDRQARLEMDKPNPGYAVVRNGFIQGGNSPDDVGDLTFLYRNFHRVSYMHDAIAVWTAGDADIAELQGLAGQMHTTLLDTSLSPAVRQAQVAALVTKVYDLDVKLTLLENQFSATLGNGSRHIADALLRITIITTSLLGLLTVAIAVLIARALIHVDRVKTEFVSLASHQLRTPLTAINWYAESLADEPQGGLSARQKSYVAELYKSGRRMSNLITDLLSVSSLDLGTYQSKITPVDMRVLVQTVLKDQQHHIDQKHLHCDVRVDERLPAVALDEHLLTGVLQNLISNSVKYTADDGHIAVTVHRQPAHVYIHVSDDGIGIPARQQAQIFSKLFRADNAKQMDTDGTGLGLYIVRAMVHFMGGKVWFTSAEHHGSDFFVRLPVR